MLEKLKEWAEKVGSKDTHIDPSIFNDPIALQTDWSPAKRGGTNFKTHKLVEVRMDRLEFKPTLGVYLFCGVFILFGMGAILLGILMPGDTSTPDSQWAMIAPAVFGVLFAGVGFGMYYYFSIPRVFDKTLGVYWRGRKEPRHYADNPESGKGARLNDIHAIQLLKEYVSGDKSSYYSYELNLVLKDGSRLNVVDYGNRKKLEVAAKKLAEFLGRPIWDAL